MSSKKGRRPNTPSVAEADPEITSAGAAVASPAVAADGIGEPTWSSSTVQVEIADEVDDWPADPFEGRDSLRRGPAWLRRLVETARRVGARRAVVRAVGGPASWWSSPTGLATAAVIISTVVFMVRASGSWYRGIDLVRLREAAVSRLELRYIAAPDDLSIAPLSRVFFWVVQRTAYPSWWPAAFTVALLVIVAGWSFWRLLSTLFGRSYRTVLVLIVFVANPLVIGAALQVTTALEVLPLTIGMSWMVLRSRHFVRNPSFGTALQPAAAMILMLAASERGLLVAAFAVGVLVVYPVEVSVASESVGQRVSALRRVLVPVGVVGVVYAVAAIVSLAASSAFSWAAVERRLLSLDVVRDVVVTSLVPSLVGGPWRWIVDDGTAPLADPPVLLTLMSWLVVVGVAVVAVRRRGRPALHLLAVGAGLTVLTVVHESLMGVAAADDRWPAAPLVGALVLALAPAALPAGGYWRDATLRPGAAAQRWWIAVTAALVVSAFISVDRPATAAGTVPAEAYLDGALSTAERLVQQRGAPVGVFDDVVPGDVVGPDASPTNTRRGLFVPAGVPVQFVTATHEPFTVLGSGRIVPAAVFDGASAVAPIEGCLAEIGGSATAQVELDTDLARGQWYLTLHYLSDRPVRLVAALDGEAVSVAVGVGPDQVTVPIRGGRRVLELAAIGGEVCVRAARVGGLRHGVFDTFSRTVVTGGLGSVTGGEWLDWAGSWFIAGGRVRIWNPEVDAASSTVDTGSRDADLEATVGGSASCGVTMRFSDERNFIAVVRAADGLGWEVRQRVDGSTQVLAVLPATGEGDVRVRVSLRADRLRVYIDGRRADVQVAAGQGGRSHGLMAMGGGVRSCRWDDVALTYGTGS